MAAGDGFFMPLKWTAQNAGVDLIKINNIMYVCFSERATSGERGYTVVRLADPNGREIYKNDLAPKGVTHIFDVDAEPSRQTNTWKLAVLTFPEGTFGVGERTLYYEDTGIAVDWSQVAG